MSTGKANIIVLGGMMDGQVFTMPLDTKALRLTWSGKLEDAVTFLVVIGDDGRRYALHPITGLDLLARVNQDWQESIKAVVAALVAANETTDGEAT